MCKLFHCLFALLWFHSSWNTVFCYLDDQLPVFRFFLVSTFQLRLLHISLSWSRTDAAGPALRINVGHNILLLTRWNLTETILKVENNHVTTQCFSTFIYFLKMIHSSSSFFRALITSPSSNVFCPEPVSDTFFFVTTFLVRYAEERLAVRLVKYCAALKDLGRH